MLCSSILHYHPKGNNLRLKFVQTIMRMPPRSYAASFPVLCRLLALLLALAVSTPVLLADDEDHDRDHDRFVDPIVGSWIVHVTVDTIEIQNPPLNPPPVLPAKFDNVAALTADGITADFSPPSNTLYGPWEKVAPRTYRQKIVTANEGGGNVTAFTGPLVLNKQGDQISGPMITIVTDKNGQITLEYSGTLLFNRITFTSTP
jgi:hypothetical protein